MDKWVALNVLSERVSEKYGYRPMKADCMVTQSVWWISLLHQDAIINNEQIDEIAESIFTQIENDEID